MELVIEKISEFLWGIPVIILILGCGMFLTVRLKGIQIRKLGLALKYMLKNEKAETVMFQVLVHCVLHFRQLLEQEILLVLQLQLQ